MASKSKSKGKSMKMNTSTQVLLALLLAAVLYMLFKGSCGNVFGSSNSKMQIYGTSTMQGPVYDTEKNMKCLLPNIKYPNGPEFNFRCCEQNDSTISAGDFRHTVCVAKDKYSYSPTLGRSGCLNGDDGEKCNVPTMKNVGDNKRYNQL